MIFALAAVGFKNGDIQYNKGRILDMIREYSGRADMVVFGETFLQGFDSLSWKYETDRQIGVSLDDPVINDIREEAKKCGIAVSFGYVERDGDSLFSSQLTIGANGDVLNNFRRVSAGWKEPFAGANYREGEGFSTFTYHGKTLSVGLCGDMWDDENVRKMQALQADIVLWPVYTDFNYEEWNKTIKQEYAEQAALFGKSVLYVNSVCLEREAREIARGGAGHFEAGAITSETPAGKESVLLVEC